MAEPLSYRGPADLTLTYGAAPGLGRTAERLYLLIEDAATARLLELECEQ
ncbi:hypothetical protein [Pseudomonas shirazica]